MTVRDDPRVVRSKASILEACAHLIAEEGIERLSVEAVAARSGAAKTTIYRHWPSRAALIFDAVGRCAGESLPTPETGSLREDLVTVLGRLAVALGDDDWCSTMRSLVDAAQRDPELARLHAETVAERRRPLTDVLERAMERGELPADLDVERAVAVLAGPLFYRAMVSRERLDEDVVAWVVDGALPSLTGRS